MNVITLKWNGEEYTLNENEAFLAADAVEDVMTLGQLVAMVQDQSKVKYARLARAYAAMLQEAGAAVNAKEIHDEFKKALASKDREEQLSLARTACLSLIGILMDSAPVEEAEGGEKKQEAPAS